jgi:hypothetical protein
VKIDNHIIQWLSEITLLNRYATDDRALGPGTRVLAQQRCKISGCHGRSLDWPFQGLGKGVEVAWQSGPAGEFFNVAWPGAVGVLTAMAPSRFAAVINQAPMRRRTRNFLGLPYDFVVNLMTALNREDGWPPDHLLRLAFETCANFEEAIALLAREPLARPAVFTVTGAETGEMAIVERTEREARVLRGPVIVANDWQKPRFGWNARMGFENNEARKAALRDVRPGKPAFRWAVPPVLNKTTRLVVEMSAAAPRPKKALPLVWCKFRG